ncbi:MAG: cobaltochelatase subunit CobT [Gammaproteobacteria bacterium]|jgi:cobaltochelatase CobT|nr:cobaltochelatase subunit CobT [Gammaproteobacteria bacterium]GIT24434.1 MAG: cobaltochelatase subunit CobT [Gammaproteobacteria bacterium]
MDRQPPVDNFCHATAGTMRAIAQDNKLAVSFADGKVGLAGHDAQLPVPPTDLAYDRVARVRGEADGMALRLRHHDSMIHNQHQPGTPSARAAFDALETVRVESLGSQHRIGIAHNLAAVRDVYCRAQGYEAVVERADDQLPDALGLLVREALTGEAPPISARTMANLWRPLVEPRLQATLDSLRSTLNDQTQFAEQVRQFLSALDFLDDEPNELTTTDPGEDEMEDPADPGQSEDEGNEQAQEQALEDGADSDLSDIDADELNMEAIDEDEVPEDASFINASQNNSQPPYDAYTDVFDEIVRAEDLCDTEELGRLRGRLDDRLAQFASVIGPLANRLQRKLLARQQFAWRFDLEEGQLNTAVLAQVVANPTDARPFMEEIETDFRDTIVSLLIDNSGSMRGRPITVAAMSADILARTLERCGVKVEILGFTTGAWKGGKSREKWLSDNTPTAPGRLNDLRHIIYKPASVPWRRAKNNLGLMLREGILKENIDGEAVLWAHQRLLQRPEQRRVLMVISDGAPVDDSTLSANSDNYLIRHLKGVIKRIEAESPIELIAIGIGHDVTHYYQRAITIDDAEQLGGTIMDELSALFD